MNMQREQNEIEDFSLNRGKSDETLNNLDEKFELQGQICRIQYDQLTINMFRDVYNENIYLENLNFDTFKLNFFRSCDELKFHILNFLMILYITKIHPEVNCVVDFKSHDIDQLKKMSVESNHLTINFQDFNDRTHYIATTGVNIKSVKVVLQNIFNAFMANEKQATYFNNEILIFQLNLRKLISIDRRTPNRKENVFLDSFKGVNFSGLLNQKNCLHKTLINLNN
jgi:hypothetical protein